MAHGLPEPTPEVRAVAKVMQKMRHGILDVGPPTRFIAPAARLVRELAAHVPPFIVTAREPDECPCACHQEDPA